MKNVLSDKLKLEVGSKEYCDGQVSTSAWDNNSFHWMKRFYQILPKIAS